jgi:hypothetical protein
MFGRAVCRLGSKRNTHSDCRKRRTPTGSSGLSVWDRLHGTLRLNVSQEDITIGVAAVRNPEEVSLPKFLKMPFEEQRDPFQLPGDGHPSRPVSKAARLELSE